MYIGFGKVFMNFLVGKEMGGFVFGWDVIWFFLDFFLDEVVGKRGEIMFDERVGSGRWYWEGVEDDKGILYVWYVGIIYIYLRFYC